MSLLLHGDCLELMKGLDSDSVDFIFCDLPYGQTSCKWDCKIDLDKFWIEVMRIKKINTPIFMTTTTKFGVDLINSAPKKCPFRYDLVWVKSAPAGFLSAKKMPMRKHEMVYVFYEKLPFYDLSSHTHKFLKSSDNIIDGDTYNEKYTYKQDKEKDLYGTDIRKEVRQGKDVGKSPIYDPPLPTSVVKEGEMTKDFTPNKNGNIYDCPDNQEFSGRNGQPRYDPPLPVSVVNEDVYDAKERFKNGKLTKHPRHLQKGDDPIYDPPLPTSMLEIKSTRGKHSTEKPVALMEWILKYYSKEGDTVLDPTMGSGSTGVACKNMNRNFIGFELDPEIYEIAVNRIND
jgi:DNA modification methylase